MKRQRIIAMATRTRNAIGQGNRVNIGIPVERECPSPCEGIPIGPVVGTQAEKKAIGKRSGVKGSVHSLHGGIQSVSKYSDHQGTETPRSKLWYCDLLGSTKISK